MHERVSVVQSSYLENQSQTDDEHQPEQCVFCEIIQGRQEASVITRDDEKRVISFMDLQGYPLVCPTEHIEGTAESIQGSLDVIEAMYGLAYKILPFVYDEEKGEGINVVTNIGPAAGQEVPHLHVHLIPRTTEDRLVRLIRRTNQPREVLDRRAEQIRIKLQVQNNRG